MAIKQHMTQEILVLRKQMDEIAPSIVFFTIVQHAVWKIIPFVFLNFPPFDLLMLKFSWE